MVFATNRTELVVAKFHYDNSVILGLLFVVVEDTTDAVNQASICIPSLSNEDIIQLKDLLIKSTNFNFHTEYFQDKWIVDTGAAQHMIENFQVFDKIENNQNKEYVTIQVGKRVK